MRSTVRDMKYVLSTSRDNISNILVWFKQVDDATFRQRLIDLRRMDHTLDGRQSGPGSHAGLPSGELRSSVSFAGIQLTETQPFYGDTLGQIMFSLHPRAHGSREVSVIADAVLQRMARNTGSLPGCLYRFFR